MDAAIEFLFRWVHFLAGITWIGILYFFNLVNVRFLASVDASARPFVIPTLLPRALAWFRHGAWMTVLAGLVLMWIIYWRGGHFVDTPGAKTIHMGMLLGLIMLFNVWVLIWPNQKKIIEATRAKQTPDPSWGRVALYASRTNFILSFPMLLYMAGASHAASRFGFDWLEIILLGLVATGLGAFIVFYVQKWAAAKF